MIRNILAAVVLVPFYAAAEDGSSEDQSPLPATVEFNRDIRPLLSENCYKCHGPDPKAREGGLRFDTREGIFAALEEGRHAVVAGNLSTSELWKRITSGAKDEKMPPAKSGKKLTPRDVAVLKKWIEQGAPWQGHWAFIPIQRPPAPPVRHPAWPQNAIDAFILARLEKEGLLPSPLADPVALLRRLSFDLTGLPPGVADVEQFLANPSGGYEKAVDRLLASPHYGERMAMLWLDLVRYADSRGYHSDNPRNVSPYRDYVIDAFNENMPFNQFTTEQLAGDLLPNATLRQKVASGYNKLNLTTEEGGAQAREYEAKTAADRVRNASGVWMGVTMGCCECHDHKFDPFTTKDFYRLAAFFADIKEGAIGDGDKGIYVPTDAQALELKRFEDGIAALKKTLDTPTSELASAQAEWEKKALLPAPWILLDPESVKSKDGTEFLIEEDGSVIATGKTVAKDTYTVALKIPIAAATGLRLEALTWPTLPKSGPGRGSNGNFVLSTFSAKSGDKTVTLKKAVADHSQDQFAVAGTLDGKKDSGWAILPESGKDHTAVFEFKEPFGKTAGSTLVLTLDFRSNQNEHTLGRFRLSATADGSPAAGVTVPAKIRAILAIEAEKRTDAQKKDLAAHYRTIAPMLDQTRSELSSTEKKLEDFQKGIRRCLVSVSAAPRTLRVLPRGNWLDSSGEQVTSGVPQFLRQVNTGEKRASRLDLAEWLVSRDNPLTARVFVNRLWKMCFGMGLSKRLDDLGAQGEWPVHPELLDWMAIEFMEDGWNVKHAVKRIVMSATYRQDSKPTKTLRERDPFNRLVACQSRWRLDAEVVRDVALSVSGLLVTTVGGDSVKPYQPRGYWSFLNFPTREWENDKGESAYRRGLYTWWQRTFIHPSLMAFDAPNREECCAERARSNIPQQALVLLNDPTYVEAARAFADRILKEGGTTPVERITWAVQRALSRRPLDQEVAVLKDLQ
ncbi:MAG TPA: PSD1 and planctomycete cytochrome C domain-containing protein, partial [Planctomycetota bacterium]|nr:PSD1 and planctomycete cytochrome C domain-containing protein [Planctomycetota bacterium]